MGKCWLSDRSPDGSFETQFTRRAGRSRGEPREMDSAQPSGLVSAVLLLLALTTAARAVDVRVGEDVTLECRFNPVLMDKRHTFYWIRQNIKEKDNVAIGESPLEKNYRIIFKPAEGQYDLIVSGATYDRDNGRFECRLKEQGTGIELHAQSVDLVVLVPPQAPQISPASPVGVEGQPTELVCSSPGGSPDPQLRWYRKGEPNPLEGAVTRPGGSRTVATVSTLVVRPLKEDDGAEYRCVAWNRAMDPADKKEASVSLAVNYAPRVRVAASPASVERGGSVQIACHVDSKPAVYNVRWTRAGRYIASSFNHTLRSVSLDDDGVYVCSADNGLGQVGEAELQLDVLHAPIVTIGGEARREVDIGASVAVPCNVSAKPAPTAVEWLKEGDGAFRSAGPVLRLGRVAASDGGRYVCRATNAIGAGERSGNATFELLVRHEPGAARIAPHEPVAVDEAPVTLTCSAEPPGWPVPQYRWWKAGSESTILAVSSEYTIPAARQSSEGTYYCQPSNELGTGGSSYVNLRVYQPPKFTSQLAPSVQRKAMDAEFNVTCSAQGKPKPSIVWLKDGVEIVPAGSAAYELVTDESENRYSIFTVRSTLRFFGSERPSLNQLTADDRGVYTCAFENQVRRIESSLSLKIEHAPILMEHRPKVASSVGSAHAQLACQVRAYPAPNFEWSFRNVPIKGGSVEGGKYETNVTLMSSGAFQDVYQGLLRIADVNDADYGDYTCKMANAEGETAAAVRLQPTSAPEKPTNLRIAHAGYDSLSLAWDSGFDGGYESTIYTVLYKSADSNVRENDCQRANPCAIQGLEQLQSYTFQVRAENAKGKSPLSAMLTASTVVDLSRIPEPKQVTFEPKSKTVSFHVESPLALIALVESRLDGEWLPSQKVPVRSPVSHEVLDQVKDEAEDVRIRLCLEANATLCSEPVVAVTGNLIQRPTKALTELPAKYMVVIIVCCVLGSVVFLLVVLFCVYRRRRAHKLRKLLELEKAHGSRPAMAQQQPPPPYYAGLENKARELEAGHGCGAGDEAGAKNALYATQNGYGYAVANGGAGGDWVNLAYAEHSYSNSNNGGSVNSQDSLWQLKMAQGGAGGGGPEHQMAMGAAGTLHQERSYHYDPMTHGGYGGFEDYSHYPPSHGDDYLSQRNNYAVTGAGDPYASVHKSGKRMDHLESAYHNVSGLPDPYMENEPEEMKQPAQQPQGQQGVSLSFDESLESGYSTPNSRNRRVIREIIV